MLMKIDMVSNTNPMKNIEKLHFNANESSILSILQREYSLIGSIKVNEFIDSGKGLITEITLMDNRFKSKKKGNTYVYYKVLGKCEDFKELEETE